MELWSKKDDTTCWSNYIVFMLLEMQKRQILLLKNRPWINTKNQSVAARIIVESTPQTQTLSDGEATMRESERREC